MMRQSSVNMKINDKELLNQSLFDPLNSIKKERQCTRRWVVGLWIATNIATFMFGYLVKSRFDEEDKGLNGSL